jgi:hypothetical protein
MSSFVFDCLRENLFKRAQVCRVPSLTEPPGWVTADANKCDRLIRQDFLDGYIYDAIKLIASEIYLVYCLINSQ